MAAEKGEDHKNQQGKGFAGLSYYVSKVDISLPGADKQEAAETESSSDMGEHSRATDRTPSEPQTSQQKPRQPPSNTSSGSSTGMWVLGIVAAVGVLWLLGEANKSPPSTAPSYTPPTTYSSPAGSTSSISSEPRNISPTDMPSSSRPQVSTRLEEVKPPVGQGRTFSTAQIRYCLAEDIRMDGARSVLNNRSDSDINRFNSMVDDYNNRCGNFRYRSGSLVSARRAVESYRNQLLDEGKKQFSRGPSASALSDPVPATSSPARDTLTAPAQYSVDETVKEVQKKLNEIGYNSGPTDGIMGRLTRSAIVAFQQDRGLAVTGVADQALLARLQQAPARPQALRPEASSPTPSQPLTLGTSSSTQRATTDGRPDISEASQTEQASIERACSTARQYLGPGDYYSCLRRELQKLSSSGGMPSLSHLPQSEKVSIERMCNTARQYLGPGDYYSCLRRELQKLSSSGGIPSLIHLPQSEKTSIEKVCSTARQHLGPGDYYNCLGRELQKLTSSGGMPSLSNLVKSEKASVERACNTARQYLGPGDYYNCLRREANKLR